MNLSGGTIIGTMVSHWSAQHLLMAFGTSEDQVGKLVGRLHVGGVALL